MKMCSDEVIAQAREYMVWNKENKEPAPFYILKIHNRYHCLWYAGLDIYADLILAIAVYGFKKAHKICGYKNKKFNPFIKEFDNLQTAKSFCVLYAAKAN